MKTLLTIDHDPFFIETIAGSVPDDFQVIPYTNPVEGIEKVFKDYNDIDIILLDIQMPEMDGYEVCRKIKENPDCQHIPILFISGLNSTDDLISGFEAGAIDYISKPFDFELFTAKINNICQLNQRQTQLKSDLQKAQSSALNAFKSLSEVGSVIEFLQSMPKMDSYQKISQSIIAFTRYYDLESIIQISPESVIGNAQNRKAGVLNFSSHGNITPITNDLLNKLKDKGAKYTYKNIAYFNQNNISLLILNMPVENNEEKHRLSAYLPAILNGACSAIAALSVKQHTELLLKKEYEQTTKLNQLINTVENVLKIIKNDEEKQKEKYAETMSHLVSSVEDSFLYLGLSEQQEQELLNIVLKSDHKLHELFDKSQLLTEKLSMLKALIKL